MLTETKHRRPTFVLLHLINALCMTLQDRDYILCECTLENLLDFVERRLEPQYNIRLSSPPATCLTMLRAQDTVEHQAFYLGEALTTECAVEINGTAGYGVCLGDEPERAYCIGVIDALHRQEDPYWPVIEAFLEEQAAQVSRREQQEFNQVLRTKVDFKLMDQA